MKRSVNRGRDIVDIPGVKVDVARTDERRISLRGRPWLAVMFKCCRAYSRVYRNPVGTAYEGRCPKCHRPLRVAIGPGGTDTRFFEAS